MFAHCSPLLWALLCAFLCLPLAGGCAGRGNANPQAADAAAPTPTAGTAQDQESGSDGSGAGSSGDSGGAGSAAINPLPRIPVASGSSVHISVSGGKGNAAEDMQSMLTGYLQSDLGLRPTDKAAKADVLVRVILKDIHSIGKTDAPVDGGTALSAGATGAMLGMALGGIMGGRNGSLIGAGGGLAVGLGAVFLAGSSQNSWALDAQVGIGRKGKEPRSEDMQLTRAIADGKDMNESAILPALEDRLCMDIVDALRP